jgi:hypothetical protein
MTMCWATNGIVIRTRYEKGEEPKGVFYLNLFIEAVGLPQKIILRKIK